MIHRITLWICADAQACAPPPAPDAAAAGDGVQIGKAGQATMESTACYSRVE